MEIYAQEGDVVTVHFQLSYTDGRIYASTAGDAPIKFTLGEGYLIPGFETAIRGLALGEKRVVSLAPKVAFGEKEASLIQTFPLAILPPHIPKEIGHKAEVTLPNGKPLRVIITNIDDSSVTLDANPEQAGQTMILAAELVSIE